jgi:putative Ig domain-containing protein/Ig-like domain-containing protein
LRFKHLFPICIVALFAANGTLPCRAANYYVSKGAIGGNNGANWTNAWNELDQIAWGSILPGDNIWIAGGTYSTQLIPMAEGSPGNTINIMRVLSKDLVPVAAPGWNPAFDSQVVINPSTSTNPGIGWTSGEDKMGSYVTINGRLDTGTSCGIQVNVANGSTGGAVKMDTGNSGVVLQYVDIAGPGESTPFTYTSNLSALYAVVIAGRGTIYDASFLNCRIHGAVNGALIGGVVGISFEHCKFYDDSVQNAATYHPNVLYSTGSTGTLIFAYNEVWNWDNEGIFLKNTPQTWYIYENLFHDSVGAGRALQADNTSHTVFFYANTLVNLQFAYLGDTGSGGTFSSSSQSRNNIYWNVPGGPTGIADEDYGFTDATYLTGHNAIINGSNPFLDYALEDYRIVSSLGATSPRSRGLSLPSQYGPDLDWNIRPANPLPWDIGAFQFVTVAPYYTAEPPATQSVEIGASVTFTASVIGEPSPTYQWYVNGTLIPGATNFSYELNDVTSENEGTYTLVATNGVGSPVATLGDTLTVIAPPPVITSVASASGTQDIQFSFAINATNSPTSYNATGLPNGLSIGKANGVISGLPSSVGQFKVTISATNSGGTTTGSLIIVIIPPLS